MISDATFVMLCLCMFRERERKLEARNAALQTSVQQLEKKIQQKVMMYMSQWSSVQHPQAHESSRRYGQQLEQKKLVAVTISRHTSSDDAPKVEVYKKKKWCTVCDVGVSVLHVQKFSRMHTRSMNNNVDNLYR